MAQRKLQQELDRCFKRVAEGIAAFESIFEKINQTSNQSQKEKLEDALKREIKKLQRHRDQIKTWAASNEIKDKKPLVEHRKLIETQMERFKAVEKEMKTKAYSKEGLSAAAKLDPKEKEKMEVCTFLSGMVEELERQIEQFEAESETLQAGLKKGRKDTSKAERVAEVERMVERHKWHQSKLELILRLVENGNIEPDQVKDIKEDIKFYVEFNQENDFTEDEDIYEVLNLDEEEDAYVVGLENDRQSSQDAQSLQDEPPEKSKSADAHSSSATRRPSTQLKSPMPAVVGLHVPPSISNGASMKPAPLPSRPAGETLKYASAAAAGASADKNLGIAPLPPPPGMSPQQSLLSASPPMASNMAQAAPKQPKPSPKPSTVQPATDTVPQLSKQATPAGSVAGASIPPTPSLDFAEAAPSVSSAVQTPASTHSVPVAVPNMQREGSSQSQTQSSSQSSAPEPSPPAEEPAAPLETVPEQDGDDNASSSLFTTPNEITGRSPAQSHQTLTSEDAVQANGTALEDSSSTMNSVMDRYSPEDLNNLPPGLRDLLTGFNAVKARKPNPTSDHSLQYLASSAATLPVAQDAERPRHYKPDTPYNTPSHYPQDVMNIFDDPSLYRKVDTDTLFYIFYYRQGTYQQYLAAMQLKRLSWRFHKQYQTWFQRHEEPKVITEEYEQGTYRFFDYESTWMNRRKSDFKFAYQFLEDELP